MKLWAGRFQKETDQRVNDFNSSISFDQRMYRQDIQGSIAHAAMLGKCGIIQEGEAQKIRQGLESILTDLESGNLDIDPEAEDIHMFVETELTKRLGDTGKRLHTARSRNDQVAVDLKLYLREEENEIFSLIWKLVHTLCCLAQQHTETVMPGYTHLQRAQPITFGHHLMAYAQMLLRDLDRLKDAKKRMNFMPLGSGALAATTYPIDRFFTAEQLGFSGPTENSLDGVSDRDFCMELASCLSILMTHLSRFFRGDNSLVQLGVSVYRTGRCLRHWFLHHASEKKPGCYRVDSWEDRSGDWRLNHPAYHDEGAASGI